MKGSLGAFHEFLGGIRDDLVLHWQPRGPEPGFLKTTIRPQYQGFTSTPAARRQANREPWLALDCGGASDDWRGIKRETGRGSMDVAIRIAAAQAWSALLMYISDKVVRAPLNLFAAGVPVNTEIK